MPAVTNKRSLVTMYADAVDPVAHRIRIVLAEKGVGVDFVETNQLKDLPAVLTQHICLLPALVDRELVLYDANIITEYLDERFPHPPLMPVYPVARAKFRMMIHRINADWMPLIERIEKGTAAEAKAARVDFQESLLSIAPIFSEKRYFLSDDFSLVDCCIGPTLWRLPHLGIQLPAKGKSIVQYGERVFERPSFKTSLLETDYALRVTEF